MFCLTFRVHFNQGTAFLYVMNRPEISQCFLCQLIQDDFKVNITKGHPLPPVSFFIAKIKIATSARWVSRLTSWVLIQKQRPPDLSKTSKESRRPAAVLPVCWTVPCHKSRGARIVEVDENLNPLKQKVHALLNSEQGIQKWKKRCFDVEPVFGNIKQNHGFKRFKLRGKAKVEIEWGGDLHWSIRWLDYQEKKLPERLFLAFISSITTSFDGVITHTNFYSDISRHKQKKTASFIYDTAPSLL